MESNLVNRLNTAVEFLKDDMTFKVGEFVLGVVDSNTIFVNGYSNFSSLENLSKEKAVQELKQIKTSFNNIISEAREFSNYLKNKTIEYNLVIDSGGGGVTICKERKGIMEFFI